MAKRQNEEIQPNGALFEIPIEEVMPSSMLPYAEYVILDRALPRVEDGLKPVQRRILFTMNEMGLTPDKPHKKCARIVGDCMGKYHPHGDSSVYDAMVRLAQDFNMGATLVNGHGNFGSVDGDPAAAMRYTEARLEPLALELLRDLDKNTVHFSPNFDDSLKEPDLLPGRFPNLLVNGASGIAVGLATNIPTHNLAETIDAAIAYIENPKITLKEIMKYIPGPDFPTGGYIVANELNQAYETGKGKITLRAKMFVEGGENDKKHIVITELPYQTNKAQLLRKIAELKEEKKEPLTEQIVNIADESDRVGMRAVITVRKDADIDAIIKYLCKNTDLQVTFGINMVAIADGKPQQLGLLSIIRAYVKYQRKIIYNRTKFDLEAAKERCHILEGLIIAVRNIDEVIAIIKNADGVSDAREKLMERFSLSERQAQAILDLRLARLTKLEVFKLEQELEELKKTIARLEEILSSERKQYDVVVKELNEIKDKYRRPRRSEIVGSEDDIVIRRADEKAPGKNCYFLFTADNKVKVVDEEEFNSANKEPKKLNDVYLCVMNTMTDKKLCAITDKGYLHKFDIDKAECRLKDNGSKVSDFISDSEDDEKPIAFFEYEPLPDGELIFFTEKGMVKRTAWSEFSLAKDDFQVVKLVDGDKLVSVQPYKGDRYTMFFVTENGIGLNAETSDVPLQGRIASGVKGILLSEGDKVLAVEQIEDEGEIVLVSSDNKFKKIILAQLDVSKRYRKGCRIALLSDGARLISAKAVTDPYMLCVENKDGSVATLSTEDVKIEIFTTKGRKIRGREDIDPKRVFALKYFSPRKRK